MRRGLGFGIGLLLSRGRYAPIPLECKSGALSFVLRRSICTADGDISARCCSRGQRGFCGYAVEQFSDDEYECEFENQKPSSSVANIDEWRWKLSLLLRNSEEQEIVSRDKRDRRDYEQISNIAKRMGLYSELYGKVVVASKVPLPNYRPDLDDKRPQREVAVPLSLQRRVESLLEEHVDRMMLTSNKVNEELKQGSSSKDVVDVQPYESQDSLIDNSMMEKILQRKSTRMRNLQRTWQVDCDSSLPMFVYH